MYRTEFAVAIVVALVAAIVAPPFLLVRATRRRWRSGRTMSVYTARAKATKASLLTAAGEQAVTPMTTGAPVR